MLSDSDVPVTVVWKDHFINEIHDKGKFLAEVEKYPIQFADVEDSGILFATKSVN